MCSSLFFGIKQYSLTEQGRVYRTVNFVTPGEGDLMLGRDHNSYMYSENAYIGIFAMIYNSEAVLY